MKTEIIKLPKDHWANYQIFVRNDQNSIMVDSQICGTKREAEQELKNILKELK